MNIKYFQLNKRAPLSYSSISFTYYVAPQLFTNYAEVFSKLYDDSRPCTQQNTRAGLSHKLGWPELLISFTVTLSRGTKLAVGRLVLRVREYVSPAEAVPNQSLVTGRLATGRI